MRPTTQTAYELFHNGMLAFADIQENGMTLDLEYAKKAFITLGEELEVLVTELDSMEEGLIWKKIYGKTKSYDSNPQTAKVLFEECGYESVDVTASGKPSTNADALMKVKTPFIEKLIEWRKLGKARNTYIGGLLKEQVDGIVHPNFNLHFAKTFRSSSDSPNFQNMPIRDPKMGKIIRNCVVPPKGMGLFEFDYSGIEVSIAYCYHKDPTMKTYLEDSSTDMHRDVSMMCFMLPKEEMNKMIRFAGKSGFTFAQFYGDYWGSNAKMLWNYIDELKLVTNSGVGLKDHLKSKGIKELGTIDSKGRPSKGSFYAHLKTVEEKFWGEMFPIYTKWKETWWEEYCLNGEFTSKTGFTSQGLMTKNQCINAPIQGSAFHCNLWSVIEINKWLKKENMKSYLIGQIHDSLVGYYHPDELEILIAKVKEIGTTLLMKKWDWINTPLNIDVELACVGQSWYHKEECDPKTIYRDEKGLHHIITDKKGKQHIITLCGK